MRELQNEKIQSQNQDLFMPLSVLEEEMLSLSSSSKPSPKKNGIEHQPTDNQQIASVTAEVNSSIELHRLNNQMETLIKTMEEFRIQWGKTLDLDIM